MYSMFLLHTLEPVFLLEDSDWNTLINDSKAKLPIGKYIAYYMLDQNQKKMKFLKRIQKDLNMEVIDLSQDLTRPVVDFVKYIANASFVVTDSFHGCCFSIIFKKQFIGLLNSHRGATRFESLFPKLNLYNRILTNIEDFEANKEMLYAPIDYDSVHKILEKEKEYTINWLKTALEAPKVRTYTEDEEYISTYFDELENELSGLTWQVITLDKKVKNINQLLLKKNSICKTYYRYKILSKLMIGKKREHYKNKARIYNEKVKQIRQLEKDM